MEKQPLVTIGIPTYNSGRYLRACLDSILGQTYSNLEIIVSDNGSTDDTEKIVSSYSDPRMRFNRNQENVYCYGNYNVIIGLAKGELLAIYHSDDVYEPSIVEREVEFLQDHTGVAAVFTEAHMLNSKSSVIGKWCFPRNFSGVDVLNFKKAYNGFLQFGDFLICPSAMFIRRLFSEVGSFREEKFFASHDAEMWTELLRKYHMKENLIFTAIDLEMWLRILQKYPIGILHEKLMFYRIHSGQGTFEHSTASVNFFLVMDYYADYSRKKNLILKNAWRKYEVRKLREEFDKGQNALLDGDFLQAKRHFHKYIESPYLLYLFISYNNLIRVLWAFLISSTIPLTSGIFFQKVLRSYRTIKERRNKKKMSLF